MTHQVPEQAQTEIAESGEIVFAVELRARTSDKLCSDGSSRFSVSLVAFKTHNNTATAVQTSLEVFNKGQQTKKSKERKMKPHPQQQL